MVSSNVIPDKYKAMAAVRKTPETLFQQGKTQYFHKGQLSMPDWLKRDAAGVFFSDFKKAKDLPVLESWLSGKDENFSVDDYNSYATGTDVNGRSKIQLLFTEFDERGEEQQTKIAIFVFDDMEMAMVVLGLVDQYASPLSGAEEQ